MSRDLETQLAEYGAQIKDRQLLLTVDEATSRSESAVAGDRVRRPTRTKRPGYVAAAAFLTVLLVGLFQVLLPAEQSEVATTPTTVPSSPLTPPPNLGIFETTRGWIIYPAGWSGPLRAVDPDNPEHRDTLELPTETAGAKPVGWSPDGSLLALEDEFGGYWYVVDHFGEISSTGKVGGCCIFEHSNWLSPGGTMSSVGIWSPDGSRYAMTTERDGRTSVQVVNTDTGSTQELSGHSLGYIRHLAWSPDGTQILVAGTAVRPERRPGPYRGEANLYLFDLEDAASREIASGRYVVTAWSPDGSRVAALDYSDGPRIVVMNSDGSGLHALPGVVPAGDFQGIAWHPVP